MCVLFKYFVSEACANEKPRFSQKRQIIKIHRLTKTHKKLDSNTYANCANALKQTTAQNMMSFATRVIVVYIFFSPRTLGFHARSRKQSVDDGDDSRRERSLFCACFCLTFAQ